MTVTAEIGSLQGPPRRIGVLARALRDNWAAGVLTLVLPDGQRITMRGEQPGAHAVMVVHDYRFIDRIFARGATGFGEGFMAGEWDTPDLSVLLSEFGRNLDRLESLMAGNTLARWTINALHALRANTRSGARRNVEAHYDLGNDFYGLWLDEGMAYSSARYETGTEDLATAQRKKYAALAAAMDLRPEHHVLEIGCGWGGFAEYAASEIGCRVSGVTISPAQLDFARSRLARQGLAARVDLQLMDYRAIQGRFDRVASIEMFEAVGEAYWPTFFDRVRSLLKPGGAAGLQVITIREDLFLGYRRQADFIQRYIFPGGMLPSADRFARQAERAGLAVRDVQYFAKDYARTLKAWREAFERASPEITRLGYDERFKRMWRFYLAYCEAGFQTGRTDVGQWILTADGAAIAAGQ